MAKPNVITTDDFRASISAVTDISTDDFLKSLADKTRSSKAELQVRLARKLKEREKCRQRMKKQRWAIQRYTTMLKTDEITMQDLGKDVINLTEAVRTAVDD